MDLKMLIDSLNQKLSEDQICNFEKNAKKWGELYGSEYNISFERHHSIYAHFI